MNVKRQIMRIAPHALARRLIEYQHRAEVSEQAESRRLLGLRGIQELDFGQYKSSETLFVLGSGASVNDLSDEQIAAIDGADSIGINFWLAHDLVPTYYLYYPGTQSTSEEAERSRSLFVRLMNKRAESYRSTCKVVTDLHKRNIDTLRALPDAFTSGTYAAERSILFARNREELRESLRRLDVRGDFAAVGHRSSLNQVFKYCASLSTAIAFGLYGGYRRIVLVGIDLGNSAYFYEDSENYPEAEGFRGSEKRSKHLTMYRLSPLMMPVDEVIYAMDDVLLRPRGISLHVQSRSSALCPRLPHFGAAEFAELSRSRGGLAV